MQQYRGKQVDSEELVYGWKVEYDFNGVMFTVIVDEAVDQYLPLVKRMISVVPSSVKQGTGEVDCNKMEIFDKDWVKATVYEGEEPQILQVRYQKGGYIIDYKDSENDCVLLGEFIGTLEITGNSELSEVQEEV